MEPRSFNRGDLKLKVKGVVVEAFNGATVV